MTALATIDKDLRRYVREVEKYPLLDREEEQALARRYRDEGDIEAAHRLVVCNLRFVARIAMQYRGYGMKLLELIQEGTIGLMQAMKKFDPDRGYRLITYAVWWIKAQIQDFILRSWSLIKLGAGNLRRRLFFKLRSERSRAEQDAWGDVDSGELARRLGVGEAEIDEMEARMAARDFSLDNPIAEDGGSAAFVDLLEGPNERSPEEIIAGHEARRLLAAAVDAVRPTLNEKEERVLDARMLADEPPTMAELGQQLDVSRQRVQQIEAKVVDKLRRALPANPGREQRPAFL